MGYAWANYHGLMVTDQHAGVAHSSQLMGFTCVTWVLDKTKKSLMVPILMGFLCKTHSDPMKTHDGLGVGTMG